MTAVHEAAAGTPEFAFSHALRRARCKVEQLFGILKNIFRCIHRHRTLHYDPNFAAEIIRACCILCNFVRRQGSVNQI